jgi:hypothetical protein
MQSLVNRKKNYLLTGWTSFCLVLCFTLHGQHLWDGEGNDGQWINPLNWNTNSLPGPVDEVVLDNSIVAGQYVVMLPAGNTAINIKRLTIAPTGSDSILVVLPKENTAVPALQISSTGYGLTLNDRAVFINASGAGAGLPVMISDSIRINNGGRYIHRTGRSHAANITVLSTAQGTESGIFEFDIPEASGTISLSDRVFGMLILSATTAGRTVNYTAAGTRSIKVRTDFIMNAAVTLNMNFSDTFFIERNFIQYASTFNCGTTARSLTILVRGDLLQSVGGIITETGTGLPALLFRGLILQHLHTKGSILNSVSIIVESAGCSLKTSLRLPYMLRLLKGRMLTTDTALLILSAGCTIQADSASGKSFIDGPVLKEGLQNEHFLFPVGKQFSMRWLALRNVSGDVQVEFMKSNPQQIGTELGTGVHHISSIEYWKINKQLLTGGNIELSFDNVNSGGVTELSSLRVAIFEAGKWENAGNSFTTGNAGGAGSVVSNSIGEFGTGDRYFTLAASTGFHNPLPFFNVIINAYGERDFTLLKWKIAAGEIARHFEIEASSDGLSYYKAGTVDYVTGINNYFFKDYNNKHTYYRIRIIVKPEEFYLSNVIYILRKESLVITLFPSIVKDQLKIKVSGNSGNKPMEGLIVSLSGVAIKKVFNGNERLNGIHLVDTRNLAAGVYYLVTGGKTMQFIKL